MVPSSTSTWSTINEAVIESCGKFVLLDKNVFTKGGYMDLLVGMSTPELQKLLSFEILTNCLSLFETRFGYCLVGFKEINGNYRCGTFNISRVSILNEYPPNSTMWEHLQAELSGISGDCKLKTEEEEEFQRKMKLSWGENKEGKIRGSLTLED